mmetsp:Transcript_29784/g.83215  ORF Transcript_29784/g.83215 Transcript_29784/m.83215 type:complete len:249 (+) Transcript_29784:767-1513(+)
MRPAHRRRRPGGPHVAAAGGRAPAGRPPPGRAHFAQRLGLPVLHQPESGMRGPRRGAGAAPVAGGAPRCGRVQRAVPGPARGRHDAARRLGAAGARLAGRPGSASGRGVLRRGGAARQIRGRGPRRRGAPCPRAGHRCLLPRGLLGQSFPDLRGRDVGLRRPPERGHVQRAHLGLPRERPDGHHPHPLQRAHGGRPGARRPDAGPDDSFRPDLRGHLGRSAAPGCVEGRGAHGAGPHPGKVHAHCVPP